MARRFHALPQLAVCLRDHGLDIPATYAEVALHDADGAQEWCFAQGENRFAALYHYKTRDFAVGSIAGYRWGNWGYQETDRACAARQKAGSADLDQPSRRNHPFRLRAAVLLGRLRHASARPPISRRWRLPISPSIDGQPDFTHAWFPHDEFDEASVDGNFALARSGDGVAILIGATRFQPGDGRPDARHRTAHGRAQGALDRPRFASLADGTSIHETADGFAGLRIEEDWHGFHRPMTLNMEQSCFAQAALSRPRAASLDPQVMDRWRRRPRIRGSRCPPNRRMPMYALHDA